jgi:hypothetical protein
MTLIWSPEAIADLVALRAYIEQDDPAARNVYRCISSKMSRRCFPIFLRSGGRVAFREHANS